jgi:hypothetical protein
MRPSPVQIALRLLGRYRRAPSWCAATNRWRTLPTGRRRNGQLSVPAGRHHRRHLEPDDDKAPAHSLTVRDIGNLTLLLSQREGLCAPGRRRARKSNMAEPISSVHSATRSVHPRMALSRRVTRRASGTLSMTCRTLSGLVPGCPLKPATSRQGGVRGDPRWTKEGEGSEHPWVQWRQVRSNPWRPEREVGMSQGHVHCNGGLGSVPSTSRMVSVPRFHTKATSLKT